MIIPQGLAPYFKAIAMIGFGLLVVDTVMSATFGLTIGYIPMIGLALISLGSGLLLVCAEFFRRIGWGAIAKASLGVWAIAFAFNVWSNMGVATSTRMGEVQEAGVQQTTYTERKTAAEEAKTRLALFTSQLDELTKAHAWAATVSADGLRGQAASLEAAVASEAKRGGCGPKCRGLQDQLTAVHERIGVAEQRDDLTKRIEATKAVLAKARADLEGTKAGISATANQSTLYAKLISFNLADDPGAAAITVANESTGVAMAIVIAIASAFLTLVGALPHLTQANEGSVDKSTFVVDAAPMPRANQASSNPVGDAQRDILDRLAALQGAARDVNLRVIHEPLRERVNAMLAQRATA